MHKIEVAKMLGTELILRASVQQLFNIPKLEEGTQLVLDFENVTIMSRSFASEYLFYTNNLNNQIQEINMCEFIKKMLFVVQNTTLKEHVIDKNTIEKHVIM